MPMLLVVGGVSKPFRPASARATRSSCLTWQLGCFFGCGLSFNVTNNPYFKAYIAGVSAAPPGHKPPSYYQLRVPLLARAKARLAPKLAAFLAAAKRTGCVICTDGWFDARNRSLFNFLVVTPSGAYFLMSVDTLGAEKLSQVSHGCLAPPTAWTWPWRTSASSHGQHLSSRRPTLSSSS